MPGINLKITTRLTICAAVFLLPLGIMLYSIISVSHASIQEDRIELKGISVLKPAVSLMQIIPQYLRLSLDNAPGNKEQTVELAEKYLDELKTRYWEHFSGKPVVIAPQVFSEYWNLIRNGGTDQVLWAYSRFFADLRQLIMYIGDISGLVTDSELISTYLILAAVHDMPQAQERIAVINHCLRLMANGVITGSQRAELDRHLEILIYSDNVRIQNRFNTLETHRIGNSQVFESLLKNCYNDIVFFAGAVEDALKNPSISEQSIATLEELAARANGSAFRLQDTALERLNFLISEVIKTNQRRFAVLLVLALVAAFAAFAITVITIMHIRRSTGMVHGVFRRLEKNDLSIQIEVLSRDELGELMMDLGGFLEKLQSVFVLFSDNASRVSNAVFDLSASAKEITTTANEQSASVAEIVSTMESNKNLSGQVTAKTIEVAELAEMTEELSQRGADLHNANEDMMAGIRDQNAKIADEIRNLTDALSRIDESVQLIDTIADRTKLIAFNAALEASSSGEAGLRFAVVAGEIRRFADNVVESVTEIKERILELQNASESLISEADIGTQAINSGYHRMVEQKEVFNSIVDVSQNVAARSQQIANLSKQQELAAAQVFIALKDISAGVKQFVTATASTSLTADNLNKVSEDLKNTLEQFQTVKQENL